MRRVAKKWGVPFAGLQFVLRYRLYAEGAPEIRSRPMKAILKPMDARWSQYCYWLAALQGNVFTLPLERTRE